MRTNYKDIWLKYIMGLAHVSERMIPFYLASFHYLSLKARGVFTEWSILCFTEGMVLSIWIWQTDLPSWRKEDALQWKMTFDG